MVILTILFIGIGWLGFRVSVAQILVTLATCAAIEVATTYRRTSLFIWPASALQTATSTALLFRVIGTENGDYWTLRGWYLFAVPITRNSRAVLVAVWSALAGQMNSEVRR